MKRILLTGCEGQLGRAFQELAAARPGEAWRFTDKDQLDITSAPALEETLSAFRPQVLINCAAYTAVDRAESEPGPARRLNVDAVAHLAEACQKQGTRLVHYSTDYAYHNGLNRPLREDDPPRPKSVYARTKLAGEEAALSLCDQSLVIRTSWVFSPFGHNFVRTMLRLGAERERLRVVYDQVGTPTYAPDLAGATLALLDLHRPPTGLLNFSNEGVTSWYDFACRIMELARLDCRVEAILSADYPTPARRPPYSLLDKSRFKSLSNYLIPHWHDSLRQCLMRLGAD
jgi:dTDP-4-dehydrorhamnose reductase